MTTVAHEDIPRAVRKRKEKKALRRRLGARVASVFVTLLSFLPRGLAMPLGRMLGALAYRCARTDRRRAIRQLEESFGDALTRDECKAITKRMFRHFGETALDIIIFSRWGPARVRSRVDVRGWDEASRRIHEVLEEGNGMIALSGHFGNWELLSSLLEHDFPDRVHAVARRYEEYGAIVEQTRNRLGVKILYHDDSPRKILEVLRSNAILGILPDQDAKNVHGIFVAFFGRSAYTPSAPANFCHRVGTPIVPLFVVRDGDAYQTIVGDPIRAEHATGDDPVRELTELWSANLEARIRERPEQWVWTHKRWNTTQEVLDRRREHDKIRRERGW